MNQFINGVLDTVNTDYKSKISILKNNKGVDQYRNAAICIDKYYLDRIGEFAQLLDNNSSKVSLCCAVCLLEVMHYNNEQEKRALEIINNEIENGNSVEKLGWKYWLEKWNNGEILTVYNAK